MTVDVTPAETPLSQRVAEEIRAWMGRRRISGAALARELNVSPAWVSYRLTGTQPIDLNDLEKIAVVLDVDVVELLPPNRERRTNPERLAGVIRGMATVRGTSELRRAPKGQSNKTTRARRGGRPPTHTTAIRGNLSTRRPARTSTTVRLASHK